MKAIRPKPLLALGLCLTSALGCDDQKEPSASGEGSQAIVSQCGLPMVSAPTAQGRARPALATAMTLPVPATIPVAGGAADATATLVYSLPADNNRALSCRYKRNGAALQLVDCDREVDATSWLEASAVDLTVSDPRARASLTICPVSGVVDQTSLRPTAEASAVRAEQMPDARNVGYDRVEGALTTQDVLSYVASARADERVKALLGERNAFIQELDATDAKSGNRTSHQLKLIFFSHSNGRTVEVTMNRSSVVNAQYIQYFPPEGKEEIEQAIELAKQDPRLAGRINDLQSGGMAFQHTENSAYLNHRVMDIRFYDAQLVSRYFAAVDLTDLKVQAAGAVQ